MVSSKAFVVFAAVAAVASPAVAYPTTRARRVDHGNVVARDVADAFARYSGHGAHRATSPGGKHRGGGLHHAVTGGKKHPHGGKHAQGIKRSDIFELLARELDSAASTPTTPPMHASGKHFKSGKHGGKAQGFGGKKAHSALGSGSPGKIAHRPGGHQARALGELFARSLLDALD